jgi:exosortase family protein XrtM
MPGSPREIRAPSAAVFALRFALLFAALATVAEWSRGTEFERFTVEGLILMPVASVACALFPAAPVEAEGRTLVGSDVRLHVRRGCEGVETLLLICAAVLAYPASSRRRLAGLAGGIGLAYLLCELRLLWLFFSLRYAPEAFALTHGLLAPLAPVVAIGLYFLWWSSAPGTRPGTASPH